MWIPPNKKQLHNREKWFTMLESPDFQQVRGSLFGAPDLYSDDSDLTCDSRMCGCALGAAYLALDVQPGFAETGLTNDMRLLMGFAYSLDGDVFLHTPQPFPTPQLPWRTFSSVMQLNDLMSLPAAAIASILRSQPSGVWTGLRRYTN